jgi:hypothetical protein
VLRNEISGTSIVEALAHQLTATVQKTSGRKGTNYRPRR